MPVATLKEVFDHMCSQFQADKAAGESAIFQFDLSGDAGGKYWVKVDNGQCVTGEGNAPTEPSMTLSASAEDYLATINGELSPMQAFMQGKIRVKGNMGLAMKLQSWFKM